MTNARKTVRIGNAQAFWGDRTQAAAEVLACEPELDYLTLDYLAEVSMSILALQRERDATAGFARDFVDVVRSLAPYWSTGGKCRVISNAGGLNPRGCAEACRAALEEAGCPALRIGIVTGDDVLSIVRNAAAGATGEFTNLDTGEPIRQVRDRLVTANAYVGAAPIVEALAMGTDIVITGRVADPSLTVGPCIHHFGWTENQLDELAGATVAGHLIECGTQVTGGISTDWLDVPDPAHLGFPIVEIASDGSCVVTKPHGTGGRVTELTVKEQLVYEIGDPANYLSPDVAVSFASLVVDDLGNDRVRVSGATGKARPESYKVSATYRGGFRSAGTLTVIGRNAETKARRVGQAVLQRVREAGFSLPDSVIEVIGCRSLSPATEKSSTGRASESVLRIAVQSDSRAAVERFSRELMPFITAGPQGTTGYAEGRPRVSPVFRYWPCLIDRAAVMSRVDLITSGGAAGGQPAQIHPAPGLAANRTRSTPTAPQPSTTSISVDAGHATHLYEIAVARSGDKGTSANIGVIARSVEWWPLLKNWLTKEVVAGYFAADGCEAVERYELPNLGALNFVVHGILRNNLRVDAQGKALGQRLLELPLPESENVVHRLQREIHK